MREIWVADCETAPFGSPEWERLVAGEVQLADVPFIWGAYNGCEYHQFKTTIEFIEFISGRECICYAHNGGKFDWFYCLRWAEAFEPVMVIAGRLAKFKIGHAEFRDSYNIIPIPLGQFQKDEIDYAIMEPGERDKPQNAKLIADYLRSDCVYLYRLVMDYIDRYGLNLTQASSAMKMWKKISGEAAPETTQGFYEDFAPYYYGGRVECFETGIINEPFEVIDINSAYPFAMMHRHAWGNSYVVSDSLPNSRAYLERSFVSICCVSRGAFPYRNKTGLTFPSDDQRREYTVTGWEFIAAVDTGTIEDWEILECITFNDSIEFGDYIDHFYAMKTEAKESGDKAGYIFAKLFLNSLYGKFAANPDKYDEYQFVEPQYIQAAEHDGYNFCAELGPWALVSRELSEEKRRYYNVATAASITGFVRAYLWRAIKSVQRPLYCDTDSIACVDTGGLELDDTRLGAWDSEAICSFGAIAGKKLYAFHTVSNEWKIASKGVRLSGEDIIRVAKGEIVNYTAEAPTFSLKRGIFFNSRNVQLTV